MSYILEALRRADAERERGAVPHLHTQTLSAAPPDIDEPRAARPWLWLAAGLALGLLAALVWTLAPGRDPAAPSDVSTSAPVAAAAPAPASDATPASGAEVASTPAPASDPAPSIVPRSLPLAPSPMAKAPAAPAASAPVTARREGTPASAAPVLGAAATADAAVPSLADLPADVRRELPPLTIGGSMYSQNAASRMLIVNGQLLREGDAVSPTVTLEQIRLRSAVLRYKTWRYEIGF